MGHNKQVLAKMYLRKVVVCALLLAIMIQSSNASHKKRSRPQLRGICGDRKLKMIEVLCSEEELQRRLILRIIYASQFRGIKKRQRQRRSKNHLDCCTRSCSVKAFQNTYCSTYLNNWRMFE